MTQVFDDNGVAYPATILRVEPNVVTALMTKENNGYDAVQVATGKQKEHRSDKASIGHAGKAYKNINEFRTRFNGDDSIEGFEMGQVLEADTFEVGDTVTVSAISKGKGFQGVVKRHNFAGGRASHGQKHSLREPGSIGATGPARVFKGTKMAGRMGSDRITVKNLKVLQVNKDENLLLLKGSVPGRKGTLVEVRGN